MKPHHLLAALFLVAAAGHAQEVRLPNGEGGTELYVPASVFQQPTPAIPQERSALRPAPAAQPCQPCVPRTYLPGPPGGTVSVPRDMPIPHISGPEQADPGDLVVLSAEQAKGDAFAWGVVGLDPGRYLEVEAGKKLIFATGKQGRYTFVLFAGSVIEGQITLRSISHEVTIGAGPNPTPPPGPGPAPNPTPDPLDDGKYKLAAAARDWAALVPAAARVRATALAGGLDALAAQVAAGTLRDMDAALEAQRTANNAALGTDKAAWQPWLERAESRFIELWDSGQMTTVQDLAVAWREIAQGLRAVQ